MTSHTAASSTSGEPTASTDAAIRTTDARADNRTAPDAFPVLPRHVAIIMDGNGRWAQQRNEPRVAGHQHGAVAARNIILEAARLGIEALTLYSFSTENWKRPPEEVDFLMNLGMHHLRAEASRIHERNIRFVHVGAREGLSDEVLADLDRMVHATAGNTGMTLGLALNYGARSEILHAVRRIAERAAAGELDPQAITDRTIADQLYTASMPDPDLLIRTAGEMRLSNFLLYQISYAELWVTSTLWPDFDEAHLHTALHDYAQRHRRFGDVS